MRDRCFFVFLTFHEFTQTQKRICTGLAFEIIIPWCYNPPVSRRHCCTQNNSRWNTLYQWRTRRGKWRADVSFPPPRVLRTFSSFSRSFFARTTRKAKISIAKHAWYVIVTVCPYSVSTTVCTRWMLKTIILSCTYRVSKKLKNTNQGTKICVEWFVLLRSKIRNFHSHCSTN